MRGDRDVAAPESDLANSGYEHQRLFQLAGKHDEKEKTIDDMKGSELPRALTDGC